MSTNEETDKIWSVLTSTLPENNKELLEREGKGPDLPNNPKPKKGEIWTLPCSAQYKWPNDNPRSWTEANRICEECKHEHFYYENIFVVCKSCQNSHFFDEPHEVYELAQLKDTWTKAIGEQVLRIPALHASFLTEKWTPELIAATITARLVPSKKAEKIQALIQKDKSPHDAILNLEEAIAFTAKEIVYGSLYGKCRIAMRSPSYILFSTFNDRDIRLHKLSTDTFAYQMFFMDGVEETPIIFIDGK